MKNIVLVFGVAFAFSTMAMASDIAFYVGQWNTDGWYDASQFKDVDTIIAQTGRLFRDIQQFDDTQLNQFGAWVDENTNDGEMDIIWLNGCIPSVLYPFPNLEPDGSRAENWLDGGNMMINVGDWFGYVSYESGVRESTNGSSGAANILDLSSGIIVSADGTNLTVTPTGKEYLPSLGGGTVGTDRPVVLSNVQAPWEVAAAFASTGGTDDPGEAQADPVVLHNTATGGYLAIINQDSGPWINDRGLTCAEFIGNWVRNVIGLGDPALAANPNPEDEAVDVTRDVTLSWEPGEFAAPTNGHKVYFGESFNDVNNATGGVAQTAASYAPPRLDFGKTYYWRVDEVNAPPTSHIEFKGDVWSFTTEPVGYPIENITATASSTHSADIGPENTVNGSGLDANDLHSNEETDMWLSSAEPLGAWIEYEFDKIYKLHQMWVWNSNQTVEPLLGFGLKDVTIEYSANGTDYTTLGTTHEFARAPGTAGYAYNTTIDFAGAATKYVRLTANSNWGGMMPQYGLSEVRFFYIPVWAREPSPDSGATDVDVDVTLGFRSGREAALHDVYFNSDEQAVIDGNVPVATVTETSYGPLSLDLDKIYYWRVDEVNEAETLATWQGDLWSFTTREFLVVDDFESYNDLDPAEPESNRIFNAWIDGYDIPTNGSLVGYGIPPFCEQIIVHGGKQSMPFFYSNTGGAASSETELTLTPAQDWTEAQVKTLAVHFHGAEGNTGQLYVKINGTKVAYDGQASNLALTGWQAWNIDLASSGASLQNVTKLAIGIDGNGASGTLYVDDIGLYPYEREFITPSEPDNTRLIGHWKFDGDTQDSSGRGNHGTSGVTPAAFVAGKVGSNAMDYRGADYVVIDGVVDDITSTNITLSAWVKTTQTNEGNVFAANDSASGHPLMFGVTGGSPFVNDGGDTTFPPPINDDLWHLITYVRDGDTGYVYADGALRGTYLAGFSLASVTRWSIGQEWDNAAASDFYNGEVDDARIYDYPLSAGEVAWLAGKTEPFDKPF
ncbi:MAG: LamG-like jellyroll fold domain-containing protein [Planctomycetota bacterium]|jgi:hypothetical protein